MHLCLTVQLANCFLTLMTDSTAAPAAVKLQAAPHLRMFRRTVQVCVEAMMPLALKAAVASVLLTEIRSDGTKRTKRRMHMVTVMVCCPM